MPRIDIAGLRHYYRMDGAGEAPVLVLSHSLGCDHSQWDAQAAQLQPHFRVLRYDIRGHGASDPTPGDYTIELLARDALAIADSLGISRFAFCGLSLGGMIGQSLAALAPDRLTHLVLANTSSPFADPSLMENRRSTVLQQGMAAVADAGTVISERFTATKSRRKITSRAETSILSFIGFITANGRTKIPIFPKVTRSVKFTCTSCSI